MEDKTKLAAIKQLHDRFGAGIKFLSAEEANNAPLGPLAKLKGTKWTSKGKDANSPGWNVIAVPGPAATDGFTLEVIPYEEELRFEPIQVLSVKNKGPLSDSTPTAIQETELLFGLMYQQIIKTVSTHNKNTEFNVVSTAHNPNANTIHAEVGFLLAHELPDSTPAVPHFEIYRLATIPHGNSVLAPGQVFESVNPANTFIQPNSTIPLDKIGGTKLGAPYINQFNAQQFPNFDQTNPNSFLIKTLGNEKIVEMTTLTFDTTNPSGGILSIPFLQSNINTVTMNAIFWIETIKDDNGREHMQLQYTQTINLVFPPTGSTTPIVWPHVTINTLEKV